MARKVEPVVIAYSGTVPLLQPSPDDRSRLEVERGDGSDLASFLRWPGGKRWLVNVPVGTAMRAAERGARAIVANASHSTIRQLYPTASFGFLRVSRYSVISASLDIRKHFEELVVVSKQRGRTRAAK